MVPKEIVNSIDEINALVEKYPRKIPVAEIAKIFGSDADVLRNSIEEGRCPFAVGSKQTAYSRRSFVIPTIVFYSWVTQGAIFKNLEAFRLEG